MRGPEIPARQGVGSVRRKDLGCETATDCPVRAEQPRAEQDEAGWLGGDCRRWRGRRVRGDDEGGPSVQKTLMGVFRVGCQIIGTCDEDRTRLISTVKLGPINKIFSVRTRECANLKVKISETGILVGWRLGSGSAKEIEIPGAGYVKRISSGNIAVGSGGVFYGECYRRIPVRRSEGECIGSGRETGRKQSGGDYKKA